ncbi:MAG: EamA family transporter RarD [Anaerolineaceae bacterium]|nr:MAG: EamA family transporter RarD [Anaerolineaceae bacterium]
MKKGILYGIAAYALWGFFPVYWKLLQHVPAPQLLGHRIAWSFLLLMAVIFVTRQWRDFRTLLNQRTIFIYSIAAVLIGVNWLTYVWAVNEDYIVETSLGYFINPLLSVLLGVIILREKLRSFQWIPVGLAAVGVIYLTIVYGQLPWIALTLAFSFGFYGLVKKIAPLSSLYGLTLETGLLFLPALGFLAFSEIRGDGAFTHAGLASDLLLIGAGVVTTIPLLMFASAARQIPLTVVGLLQYIAPTLQFLLGVLVYHEPFDQTRLIGFSIVWLALIIFWVENYLAHRAPAEPIPELGEG